MKRKPETRDEAIQRAFFTRRRVLFRVTADIVHRIPRIPGYAVPRTQAIGYLYYGTIVRTDIRKDRLRVEFKLVGAKLAMWIYIRNVSFAYDHNLGEPMTIAGHTASMIDLRTEEEKTADTENPYL